MGPPVMVSAMRTMRAPKSEIASAPKRIRYQCCGMMVEPITYRLAIDMAVREMPAPWVATRSETMAIVNATH